jgi:hypothetical protein
MKVLARCADPGGRSPVVPRGRIVARAPAGS